MLCTNAKDTYVILNYLNHSMSTQNPKEDSSRYEIAVNAIALVRDHYGSSHRDINSLLEVYDDEFKTNEALCGANIETKVLVFENLANFSDLYTVKRRIAKLEKHFKPSSQLVSKNADGKTETKWEKAVRKYQEKAEPYCTHVTEPYKDRQTAVETLAMIVNRPFDAASKLLDATLEMVDTVFADYNPDRAGLGYFRSRFINLMACVCIKIDTNKDYYGNLYGSIDDLDITESGNIVLVDLKTDLLDAPDVIGKIANKPEYVDKYILAKSYLDKDVFVTVNGKLNKLLVKTIINYFLVRELRINGVNVESHSYSGDKPRFMYWAGLAFKGTAEELKGKLNIISDVFTKVMNAVESNDICQINPGEIKIHYDGKRGLDDLGMDFTSYFDD